MRSLVPAAKTRIRTVLLPPEYTTAAQDNKGALAEEPDPARRYCGLLRTGPPPGEEGSGLQIARGLWMQSHLEADGQEAAKVGGRPAWMRAAACWFAGCSALCGGPREISPLLGEPLLSLHLPYTLNIKSVNRLKGPFGSFMEEREWRVALEMKPSANQPKPP
ncbi:hypothetical protein NDU88_000785 [Pleurodeles waltl]|uniref:Uncharacterized protein n=1 Tax=Pleurodeles waltl TaxID=8319 RepID=A0AAV7MJW2_PLEWA|nr:hypothetical protein NDU88_000785 [Pleurodeles waltl]